jgi:hypothetical protein
VDIHYNESTDGAPEFYCLPFSVVDTLVCYLVAARFIHVCPIKGLALMILVLLNDIDAKLRDILAVKHQEKRSAHISVNVGTGKGRIVLNIFFIPCKIQPPYVEVCPSVSDVSVPKLLERFFLFGMGDFDRLCGLVVRVLGYRSRGPWFDSRRYQIC